MLSFHWNRPADFFRETKRSRFKGWSWIKGCLSWHPPPQITTIYSKVHLPQRPEKKDSVKKWYEMIYVVVSLGGTMLKFDHYIICLQSTLTKLSRISSGFSTTITSGSVVKILVAIHSECLPKNTVACKMGNWRALVSLLDGFIAALTVLEGLRSGSNTQRLIKLRCDGIYLARVQGNLQAEWMLYHDAWHLSILWHKLCGKDLTEAQILGLYSHKIANIPTFRVTKKSHHWERSLWFDSKGGFGKGFFGQFLGG